MKRNAWILLGIASLSIATLAPQVYGQNGITLSSPDTGTIIAQARPATVMSGAFKAGEKPATGKAMIVREGGHSFLQLDAAFSTSDQGPDLHVLLDTMSNAPKTYPGATGNRVINLGKLKSFSGAQRYPIPDSVNLANYKSVVIWCRMANATFAYAPLSGK
jgi:Electron transfer DM13